MFTAETINILLIEDEEYDVRRIKRTLQPIENRVRILDVVSNGRAAIELLEQGRRLYDVVIMDFQIAGGLMGESLIRKIKEIDATLQIIVVTKMTVNMTDFDFANRLLEAGAIWYCTKYPGDIEDYIYQPTDFILSIFNAFEKRKLEKEKIRSHKRLQKNIQDILDRKQIIGESPTIQALRQQIRQCAQMDANVVIHGASGTGKELVATHIHYHSKRKLETFLPINCGSLPANLIESELFGFEKGSFTGASTKKLGLFEVANKGTIFLDEITELPLSAQSTLLRVIQEGEIDKIGRTEKLQVDVRIIAATNKNLAHEVRDKRFREDLYYRLNVVTITVPSLAQLRDDIPLLFQHYLRIFSQEMNKELPEIEADAIDIITQYDWPGNVRELQNVVQRLLFMGERRVDTDHVKMALGLFPMPTAQAEPDRICLWDKRNILPWRQMEAELRAKYFRFVRDNTRSDAEAARKLGLAPPNYHRMCKELGLK